MEMDGEEDYAAYTNNLVTLSSALFSLILSSSLSYCPFLTDKLTLSRLDENNAIDIM